MPRSAEAKLRRRNRKKADSDQAKDTPGQVDWEDDGDVDADDDTPGDVNVESTIKEDPIELFPTKTASSIDTITLPKLKKTTLKKKSNPAVKASSGGTSGISSSGGIKTTPLILLILMVGTTVFPAVLYAGDYISHILSKNDILGNIGFRLGIGAVPKKRVLSFYEKHAPQKLDEVPNILSKHYGQYPQLIKKLERKYQDYGYFVGWEQDEAPITIALEQLKSTYQKWIQHYWNVYAPQALKTAARNVRYNLTFLFKKGKRMWKKYVWPILEPIFGVPDGGAAQKRRDAAEARKRKSKNTGARSRRADYRDDVED